ncbi:MAG TPA: hypothetical protein PKC96_04710 [Bacilli bacterium]|nr:hypothetical protein [Bacilli bacterium]
MMENKSSKPKISMFTIYRERLSTSLALLVALFLNPVIALMIAIGSFVSIRNDRTGNFPFYDTEDYRFSIITLIVIAFYTVVYFIYIAG